MVFNFALGKLFNFSCFISFELGSHKSGFLFGRLPVTVAEKAFANDLIVGINYKFSKLVREAFRSSLFTETMSLLSL
jgi:hypothetical protein